MSAKRAKLWPPSRPPPPHPPTPTASLARVIPAATRSHRLGRAIAPWPQRGAGHRRRFQPEVQRLQPLDLVAQACAFLELQVRGRAADALLEFEEGRLQVLADELR